MVRKQSAQLFLACAFSTVLTIPNPPRASAADIAASDPLTKTANVLSLSDGVLSTVDTTLVEDMVFRSTLTTDGKLAVNEDTSTPVFPAYAGRVVRIMVKPGDTVRSGDTLFTIEAQDMVQAQSDLMAAVGQFNKARSQENLTAIAERRLGDLFRASAAARKDWEQAQADVTAARNDVRAAQIAVDAGSNRMRMIGRTDAEVKQFIDSGILLAETRVYAPLSGTVVQRKIGPGQFIGSGATDPVVTIGDLSSVWVVANVRESDIGKLRLGQAMDLRLLAFPDETFSARIDHIAASVDPVTRRLQVRGTIQNADGRLRPEMFATVRIGIDSPIASAAVPRQALIYDGDRARLGVVSKGRVEFRPVDTGLVNGNFVEIRGGVQSGERIVTRGNLLLDSLASAGPT